LKVRQSTPSQPNNLPFHIPVSLGIIDSVTGDEVLTNTVVELKEEKKVFEFKLDVNKVQGANPIPSLFRGFSAPVRVIRENFENEGEIEIENMKDMISLAKHDTDGFNRWEGKRSLV